MAASRRESPILGIGVSRSPILLYNGAAILMGYDLRSGTTLMSVDRATMKIQWRLRLKDEVARYSPVLENDQLILSGENLWIVSLKDGKISFRKTLASPIVPPAVAPDRVVLQTSPKVFVGD